MGTEEIKAVIEMVDDEITATITVTEEAENKIFLLNFLDRVAPRIVGGDKYTWECYGEYARYLDLERNVGIVFDENSHRIYEMSISDQGIATHIWRNPIWEDTYIAELKTRRNITHKEAMKSASNTSVDDFIMHVIGLYERPAF